MSNLQVLGTVVTSGTATVTMVQQEPIPARDVETSVDMEVDKIDEDVTTPDEEEGQVNDDTLIDYNEEGTTTASEAATKAAYLKDLMIMMVGFNRPGTSIQEFPFPSHQHTKNYYEFPV
jgi:hypothetical protein